MDADGEPVTGANVQLQPLNAKKNRPVGVYASSDDRGAYRAYNIPPGKYKLSVTYSGRRGEDLRVKIHEAKDKTKDASPNGYGTTYSPDTLHAGQARVVQVAVGADIRRIDIGLSPCGLRILHHTRQAFAETIGWLAEQLKAF